MESIPILNNPLEFDPSVGSACADAGFYVRKIINITLKITRNDVAFGDTSLSACKEYAIQAGLME